MRESSKRALMWPLALLMAAAFLRFYRLDTLPPGMISDIATNGLDIRDVLAGHPQVFFPANYGREAFFVYFQGLLVAGAGFSPFVFTYAAVAMGMLTVALSYRLFRSMIGPLTAWLAALLLASSFWMVAMSRIGLRTTSLPPFALLTIYGLWRLLRSGRQRYAWLAGFALGGSLYSYIAARLLPVLLVLLCLADWQVARKRWRELALAAGVAVAVFAPEGLYFLQHPEQMLQRTEQVAVFNQQPTIQREFDTPLQSLVNTAGMFFVRGDSNQQLNLPGRPIFDPLLAAFFAAGVAGSIWLARPNVACRWLLLWLVVMSLPSALSHESPDTFRVLAVAPPTFALAALGARWLPTVLRRPRWGALVGGLAAAWYASWTVYLYFGVWAHDPKTYAAYAGGVTKLASYVAARPEAHMVFAYHNRWPVELLTPRTNAAQWYAQDEAAIPVPANPEGDILYVAQPASVLSHLSPSELPGLVSLPHPNDPTGAPDFLAFRWPLEPAQQFLAAQQPANADMSPDFRLVSSSVRREGNSVVLDLLWQPLAASGPYDLYVHLLDSSGKQTAQSDVLARPPDDGPTSGYLLLTEHTLVAPPGNYMAEAGVAHRSVEHPEQVVGGAIGQAARLPLTVPAG